MLAIYIPLIRREIEGFVRLWNNHPIRRQPKRPNAVVGKPVWNYCHARVQHYGVPYDPNVLDQLQNDVNEFGIS
jgi:hypothetical protein